jgi:sugar/nucleoside kinase (ribokinase family)
MNKINRDITFLGNAIVDILGETSDEVLIELQIPKGGMQLIDSDTADKLINNIKQPTIVSGGSAANTAVGFSSFGGSSCFIGQTGFDKFGKLFSEDINQSKVFFENKATNNLNKTSKSVILVTPDAERSMSTFLGASVDFNIDCVNEDLILNSKILYIEGYLFDQPEAKKAIYHCCKLAQKNNIQIALSLSDSFCVERHREDFLNLIKTFINIIFANNSELTALYQLDYDLSLRKIRNDVETGAVTRGELGAFVWKNNGDESAEDQEELTIEAYEIQTIVDTTGAGDLFASGFLYGLINDYPLVACGNLGSKAASEIIQHYGARPKALLKV